jgi:hypothetical protein
MGRNLLAPHGAFPSPHLTPAIIYLTGIAWVLAGIVLFGYLYMLRRELGLLPNSPAARSERHPS